MAVYGLAVDRLVGDLVAPDEYRAVLAEQQEIVVGAQETGFGLHVCEGRRGIFLVEVDIFQEDGALVDADVVIRPVIEVGRGAAVVAGSELGVVDPLVPREQRLVRTSYRPAVHAYDLFLLGNVGVKVAQVFLDFRFLPENILDLGLVVQFHVEERLAGGQRKGQ